MGYTEDRLSPVKLSAFVSLEIPMAAFLMPLIVYIPAFYAGEMGLGLTTVGVIFGLTKLWDIVTDPIAGSITERYGPVKGRWRFWLLISLPLMSVGIYRIFLPPESIDWTYFVTWMLVLYVGWTLLTIAHISWGVELSDDYHERARVAAYRQFAALIGSLLVVIVPVVSDQFIGSSEKLRVGNMGLFVLVSLPILMMATIWAVPATGSGFRNSTSFRWRDSILILIHNRDLRALLLGNMGVLLGMAAMSSALLFYVESVLLLKDWASFAVVPMLFSGLLFLPILKYLTYRLGKQKVFQLILLFQISMQPLFLILPPENLTLTVISFLILGAINGSAIFLPQAMIADVKDIGVDSCVPACDRKARTGIYVALLQSTSKISAALAVALMFLVLPMTGFDPSPDAVNHTESLLGLRCMMAGLPMVCFLVAWYSIRNYSLDSSTKPITIGV